MTRVARGVDPICHRLNMFFFKYHLEVVLILNHVFIDHQGCIWTYEIDRFKSS
jgi:hypothetical protein